MRRIAAERARSGSNPAKAPSPDWSRTSRSAAAVENRLERRAHERGGCVRSRFPARFVEQVEQCPGGRREGRDVGPLPFPEDRGIVVEAPREGPGEKRVPERIEPRQDAPPRRPARVRAVVRRRAGRAADPPQDVVFAQQRGDVVPGAGARAGGEDGDEAGRHAAQRRSRQPALLRIVQVELLAGERGGQVAEQRAVAKAEFGDGPAGVRVGKVPGEFPGERRVGRRADDVFVAQGKHGTVRAGPGLDARASPFVELVPVGFVRVDEDRHRPVRVREDVVEDGDRIGQGRQDDFPDLRGERRRGGAGGADAFRLVAQAVSVQEGEEVRFQPGQVPPAFRLVARGPVLLEDGGRARIGRDVLHGESARAEDPPQFLQLAEEGKQVVRVGGGRSGGEQMRPARRGWRPAAASEKGQERRAGLRPRGGRRVVVAAADQLHRLHDPRRDEPASREPARQREPQRAAALRRRHDDEDVGERRRAGGVGPDSSRQPVRDDVDQLSAGIEIVGNRLSSRRGRRHGTSRRSRG